MHSYFCGASTILGMCKYMYIRYYNQMVLHIIWLQWDNMDRKQYIGPNELFQFHVCYRTFTGN